MQFDSRSIHLLPGRLRIAVPDLYRNSQLARKMEKSLATLLGVKSVQANVFTGKLLIYYQESSLDIIIDYLKHILVRPEKEVAVSISPPKVKKEGILSLLPSAENSLIPWYSMTGKESAYALSSDPLGGISQSNWAARYQKYGPNILEEKKQLSFLNLVWQQFQSFMVRLMLGASGVSFLLGEVMDGCTILAIVFLETVIGVIQEYKAEKSLAALKEMTAPTACVYRDGQELIIPARELVPGDVIILETGDHIPADARLLEAINLEVVEGALTGESLPVPKDAQVVYKDYLGIADQKNMVFMGTNVTQGRGKGVVVSTGMDTQIGQIAQMLNEISDKETPLQRGLDSLGRGLCLGCIGVCGLIALTGVLRGRPLVEMLRMGVALAVGAMPEGLGAIVTLAMAFGVQRMVKRNAIVRKLPAVENIGYTNVICSDKTGTLTKNEMTVKEIYATGLHWEVDGDGYLPQGVFKQQGKEVNPLEKEELERVLAISALCNNSRLVKNEHQQWEIKGDPTEGALLAAAAKAGLTEEAVARDYARFKEIPFDARRRRMSVVCQDKGKQQYYLYTKGAPDTILELCTSVYQEGKVKPLTTKLKKQIFASNEKMSKKALRVLALAYRPLANHLQEDFRLEQDLIFVGLIGMSDPPRQEVKKALVKCRQAGIRVVMITGDQENTATAIAQELSLLDGGLVVTGEQLATLSDEELVGIVDRIQVCTRTSPEQKLRIVRAFQQKSYIVTMTGDGVNDAPAIKESDIGVAMGRIGTDVTREASCITLTDDNFATIVMAVEEGRTIGKNIRKAICYILSGNCGEVISIFLSALMALPAPLTPCQILWVNLVTEGIMSFTLVTDPPSSEAMASPPYNPKGNILEKSLRKKVILRGLSVGLINFGVFLGSLHLTAGNILKARTIAFTHLLTSQLLHALDYRMQGGKIKKEAFWENKYLLPSLAISTGLLLGVIYPPLFQGIFQTTALNLTDWLLVLGGILGVNVLNKFLNLALANPLVCER